jgi:hypothetical protein
MQLIDATGAVASLPSPVVSTGTAPGYFAQVNASNLVPTVVSADFLNCMMLELANVATSQGATLSKSNYTQVLTAIKSLISTTTRIKLTGNLILYVATTGSDSNAGTSAAPFLTLQHAISVATTGYDYAGMNCTINLANGSYVGVASVYGGLFGTSQPLYITGNAGAPGNVVLSATSANTLTFNVGSYVILTGVTVNSSGTSSTFNGSGYSLVVGNSSLCGIHSCAFGSAGTAQISAVNGGAVTADYTSVSFSGTSPYGLNADCGGLIWLYNSPISFASGTTYTGGWALCSQGGSIQLGFNVFSSTFTGPKYSAGFCGTIALGYAPSTTTQQVIPGSAAGYPAVNTLSSTGGYVG